MGGWSGGQRDGGREVVGWVDAWMMGRWMDRSVDP